MKPKEPGKSCSGLQSQPSESSPLPSSSSPSPPSSTKYKGVRKRKWGKWVSEIRLPNSRERIWLGSYDSAEKAARAFDAALLCLRGRSANFNFPDSPPDIIWNHNLTPQEIQAVAARYANEHSDPRAGTSTKMTSSTDNPSSSQGGGEHSMDWSFLGALDENEGRVSDFRFPYSDVEYMTMDGSQLHPPPAFDTDVRDADEDHDWDDGNDGASDDGGNYTYQSSFLWSF